MCTVLQTVGIYISLLVGGVAGNLVFGPIPVQDSMIYLFTPRLSDDDFLVFRVHFPQSIPISLAVSSSPLLNADRVCHALFRLNVVTRWCSYAAAKEVHGP